MDCPVDGGKPKVAVIQFNMGGVKGQNAAVQLSMAASSSGSASGLSSSMSSAKAVRNYAVMGSLVGKVNNYGCTGPLISPNKLCYGTSQNSDGGSVITKYINVWNTGGCKGKVLVEASIGDLKTGQGSSCLGKLAELNAPRSGNADDLYCKIGKASTCTTMHNYDEILCGSIKAGYQCRAVTTTEKAPSLISVFFGGSGTTCEVNTLTCQPPNPEDACAEPNNEKEMCNVASNSDPCPTACTACKSNDCLGDDILNPTSEGGINKVAMSILALAITASLVFP